MARLQQSTWTVRLSAFALAGGLCCTAAAQSGQSPVVSRGGIGVSLNDVPLPSFNTADLDAQGAVRPLDLYLEIVLGERPTGQIARLRLHNGTLSALPETLAQIGLLVPAELVNDHDEWIALDALPGLAYRYQADTQQLFLQPPPALRPVQRIGYLPPPAIEVDRDTGWLLGYDVYGRSFAGEDTLSLLSTLRWFGRAGALEQTGISRAGDGSTAYRRLDTRWTYSDAQRMWTWTAGDLISGGLVWTRPVRLGGVQWRRNFGVRPDLVTLPIPRFSADATVPSSVELYVNNIRQFGGQVQDGPFVLDALPRISGAGQASLVVTDVLGRVTETHIPLYVDHRRLARGLSDFSFEAGVQRLGYASDDDEYGSDLVTTASFRRGLTDTLTLEAHGEAGPGLRLGGIGAVWSPGNRWGLVNASYARSNGGGSQYALGYQWNARGYGLDAQTLRRRGDYRDLGDLERDSAGFAPLGLREQDRVTLWWAVWRGSVSFNWLRWRNGADESSRTRSLSWTQNIGRISLSATVFDDTVSGRGGGLSVSVPLGGRTYGSASLRRHQRENSAVAAIRRSAPYGGGWGWRVQAGDRPGAYAQAAAEWRGRYGEAEFGVDRFSGESGAFFQGRGNLVLMDGQLFFSRRIYDAFAVVSTNGQAQIPVLSENRVFGHTGDDGYLLIPDLRGWQHNRIAIDPDGLPPDYRVDALERDVRPADHGGVLVKFDITRLHPAVLTLLGPDGQYVPAGTRGRLTTSRTAVVVGFDGEVYVEDWTGESTIELDINGLRCYYPMASMRPDTQDARRHRPSECERITP